tara:strand:+ start:12836 stop:13300 length:465 start_codon:yes stop_codon:yes gene_type:complete
VENLTKFDYAHMQAAEVYANLSSARRLQVGCVIVKEHKIISIGYNGMPSGWDNDCEDFFLDTTFAVHENDREIYGEYKTKPEVLHAETNAIAKVARSNESAVGATIYTTHAPCLDCAKLIYQSGISRVVWKNPYKCTKGLEFLGRCDIECICIE